MSESRTQRSFHDDDAVRDDPHAVEYPHGVPTGTDHALHETSDVGIKVLGVAGAVVAGLVIVALIAVALLTNLFYRSPETQPQGGSPIEPAPTIPVAVEIRADPQAAWNAYYAATQERLTTYGWVDQPAGIAHIPITRAMSLSSEGVTPALEGGTGQ